MRVVVVREYTDKYTGEGHVIGEKMDMTEERFEEIQKNGMFLVDISDEVAPQSVPDVPIEQVVESTEGGTENQEIAEPVEPAEPVKPQETPKQDKPVETEKKEKAPAKGRRTRSKKSESEDK